jgi:hypothetical protein
MPASWPSICIPRAFSNISEKRVAKVFELLELGTLDHIDMVERVDANGKKFHRIFVHFTAWSSSPEASAVRTRLLEGKEVKIVYEDPWFWKISVNKARVSNVAKAAGGGGGGPRKKHVKPTINFGGDDALQERKQEKRAEQNQSNTPPGTPPGSPRKKKVEEEEEQTELKQHPREVEGVFESDSPDTEGEAGIQLTYPEEMVMKKPAKRVRKIKKADEKADEKEKKEDGEV